MSNSKDYIEQARQAEEVKALLRKFKFDAPIPVDVQEEMLAKKKKQYKKILKLLGVLSFFKIVSISIYFLVKKFGAVSLAGKIVATAAVSVIATTTTYYGVQKIIENKYQALHITPQVIEAIDDTRRVPVVVSVLLKDKTHKPISQSVTYKVVPEDLAELISKDGVTLTFKKEGTGWLHVTWKHLYRRIPLSYTKSKKSKINKTKQQKKLHLEKVYLKDGSVFSGIIQEKGSLIRLKTKSGVLTFKKEDIKKIEYVHNK